VAKERLRVPQEKETEKRMMKLWNKTKTWDFGSTAITWRHRNGGQFFWKIFSWLLGAFVFGILTSIFFLIIQQPDLSLPTARMVFFVIFIAGIVSNLFRAIINGYEYKITDKALVHSHPFYGWEPLGRILGSEDKPFRIVYYCIYWQDVKEIREHQQDLTLLLKDEIEVQVPILPVMKVALHLNLKSSIPKERGTSKSDKEAYDKAALRIILQAAREARRAITSA
jgi:hypothetical protein